VDTILINGHVRTLTPVGRQHQALALLDGRIAALGSSRGISALATAKTRVLDLGGRTVLPGFIDSHMHAMLTGLSLRSARLETAVSVADVCHRLQAQADSAEEGQWVFGTLCLPISLAEGRFPTMQELDQVVPHNPALVINATFHSAACNSAAWKIIGPDLSAHGIEKDSSGRPTGSLLSDDTVFPAVRTALGSLSDDDMQAMYRAVGAHAASRGITTLHCLDGQFVEADRDVDVLLRFGPELPVHTVVMFQTTDVQKVVDMGLPRIGGCLTIDGAGFERTALMYDPYPDDPTNCGDLYIPEEKVRSFVLEAHRAGLQIGMHALGDRAIDILVGAYAEAMKDTPRDDCRHRVEHFCFPTPWAIEQAGELGLSLTMQPSFSWLWDQQPGSYYDALFGSERAIGSEPFGRLRDLGIMVGGGSDSPVTEVFPLLGVHSLVNNPRPERRVGVDYALRMFTINNAWIAFEEQDKGTLEVGKLADLVVLDRDPYLEPESIIDFNVDMTLKQGEITYDRDGLAARAGN